jgi:hypothetical protein
MTTLYNCHTDGDEYRITKFIDGNPESSYLLSHAECQCPAGSRPTCRHRQMLPEFISRQIIDTHWFLDWDDGKICCDFEGAPWPVIKLESASAEGDALLEPKPLCIDEGCPQSGTDHICITPQPAPLWRRI